MTDALESRLARVLVDLRPIEPVPSSLRVAVRALPDLDHARSAMGWLRVSLFVSASVAAIAALLALTTVTSPVQQVGAVRPPGLLGLDPMAEGPGVITSMVPTLPIAVVAAVLGLAAVAATRLCRKPRGWVDLLLAMAAGALAIGAIGLALHPGPGDAGWNGFGPILGFRQVETPGITDDAGQHLETLFESAGPGEPFAVVFVVGNQGLLPVRLEGVLEDPDATIRVAPRWTALGIGTDQQVVGQPLDEIASFVPTDIQPGDYVLVYLIGKASPCSIGAAPYAPDQAFAVRGPDIVLAYSILGLTSTTTYEMPVVIEEPIRNGCSG